MVYPVNFDRKIYGDSLKSEQKSEIYLSLKIYSRSISTDGLNPLQDLHLPPINLVIYKESKKETLSLGGLGASDAFSAYPVEV